jgi:predicted aldo/keto reductase-like oxidoreductase
MRIIPFGNTGLQVCRLGFGGIPIQSITEVQAVKTVLYAVEKGINFIDTARAYSTSEERIGLALKQTDKKVAICTKSLNRTFDGIRGDLEMSLKALQMEYIDIYQCHSVSDDEVYKKVISSGGAFEGLLKAKEEGLIGHIGVSVHNLDMADRIIDDGLFETILICFSFLEPKAKEKIIPKAMNKGIGISIMKPLSGGVIENGDLALKYVLAQPGTVIIPGMENKTLIDANLKILCGNYELNEAEEREIEKTQQLWNKKFCRRCGYCQPCPMDIPITSILSLPFIFKKEGAARFKEGGSRRGQIDKARLCIECEECISRCPYQLPIPSMMRENLLWLDEHNK